MTGRAAADGAARFARVYWAALAAAFAWSLAVTAAAGVRVEHVIDGDTVILDDGRHVRLLGINAPELGHDGAPDEPLAGIAARFLRELVEGRTVRLEPGRGRDRYGRLLAWLHLADGSDVQAALLRRGLGWAVAVAPDVARADSYAQAEAQARQDALGVWSDPAYRVLRAVAAARADRGFGRFRGSITRVDDDRRRVLLVLDDVLEVWIDGDEWQRHWRSAPGSWIGREVVVRGWLTERRGRPRLYIDHPLMMRRPGHEDGGG